MEDSSEEEVDEEEEEGQSLGLLVGLVVVACCAWVCFGWEEEEEEEVSEEEVEESVRSSVIVERERGREWGGEERERVGFCREEYVRSMYSDAWPTFSILIPILICIVWYTLLP